MAFRKLHFKNVQGSRSSQTLQAGELAVDESTNQLFIGDQSTAGGVAVKAQSVKTVSTYALTDTNSGYTTGDDELPITDDSSTEVIQLTNSLGSLGAVNLPNITTTGKEVIVWSNQSGTNGANIYYTSASGAGSTASVAGGAVAATQRFIWFGSYWRVWTNDG